METITKAANLKKRIFYCLSIQWNFRVSRHFLKEETWCPRIIYNRHSLQKWEPGYSGSLRRIPTPTEIVVEQKAVCRTAFFPKNKWRFDKTDPHCSVALSYLCWFGKNFDCFEGWPLNMMPPDTGSTVFNFKFPISHRTNQRTFICNVRY